MPHVFKSMRGGVLKREITKMYSEPCQTSKIGHFEKWLTAVSR